MPTTIDQGIALYVHVPFCETKCLYCDFNTYAGIEELIPDYLGAVAQEFHLWRDALGPMSSSTVFFGGGTPSYMPPVSLGPVLQAARQAFPVAAGGETTLEANPRDITPQALEAWLTAGFNRISIGVQALDDGLLRLLGRRHSAQEATDALRRARRAGFDNVSLDLMYGLPHQTLAQWQATLQQAVALAPDHLSLYCLTLEEGTPLETQVRQNLLPEPDPDLAAEMYESAEKIAGNVGYIHYEISNWSRPGYQSRHNLAYWRNLPYLGIGPGAHSSLHGYRFANLRSPRQYIRRVGEWAAQQLGPLWEDAEFHPPPPVQEQEAIPRALELAETAMLGLRLEEGIEDASFRARFGVSVEEAYPAQVPELVDLGLLERRDSALRLTPRGRLLGNEVFLRLLG